MKGGVDEVLEVAVEVGVLVELLHLWLTRWWR